ncbi:craniofacial development protein [Trema orientale]|uniref:Craniofacial development protein n=1 Tax=Trema orientale TaxID=63057 RepID=A0A2P5FL19_TREOI|nr:craniofacial development protein [Trema orientale]
MSLFKTLLSQSSHSLLRPRNIAHKPFSLCSLFKKKPPCSARTEKQGKPGKPRKPLDILFKEAVEIYPRPENGETEGEGGNNEVKSGLTELEREVRSLRASSGAQIAGKEKEFKESKGKKGLYAVFTSRVRSKESPKEMPRENPMVFNELSPDLKLFVSHLYKEGYLKGANCVTTEKNDNNGLDFSCFENSYGLGFIKFAAQNYGKDNQEIAKWLSGSDLKKVALFGCPSLERKSIFAAKRLRKFFEVQEDTVCSKCVLKQSCKFVNQNVWKSDTKKLILADVLNVTTLYALESVPPQLVVPDEIKASVSRLLNEDGHAQLHGFDYQDFILWLTIFFFKLINACDNEVSRKNNVYGLIHLHGDESDDG